MLDPIQSQLARETGITAEQARRVVEFLQRNRDRLAELDRPLSGSPTTRDKPDHLLGLF